jgi:hypothetical protein
MTAEEKDKGRFTREGVLELTWNHGTEKDESFAGYASGNEDPGKGFGHICLWVPLHSISFVAVMSAKLTLISVHTADLL